MSNYPWKSIPFDIKLLKILSDKTVVPGNQYEWGGKVDDDAEAAEVVANGIDCSGYTHWIVSRCAGIKIPHGSVAQHDWVVEQGFKQSSVESAELMDDHLRIAFLKPIYKGGNMIRAGHVALIRNGMTFESRGGAGPDRRKWDGKGWQSLAAVYVLSKKDDQY